MAVGARGRDILTQFLIEAVTLSIIGGLIGIAMGVGGINSNHLLWWMAHDHRDRISVSRLWLLSGGGHLFWLFSCAKGGESGPN